MKTLFLALLLVSSLLRPLTTSAGESDDYTLLPDFAQTEPDAITMANDYVNGRLAQIVNAWPADPADEWTRAGKSRFVRHLYRRFEYNGYGSRVQGHLANRLYGDTSKWSRYRSRQGTIYEGSAVWHGPVLFIFGVVPTLNLGGTPVGGDKIAHFFDGGWHYYLKSFIGDDPIEKSLKWGRTSEASFLGRMGTGIFSNADLVANYEGYLFYLSLTEDDVIPGKPAIIAQGPEGLFIQRPFDFADHVNDYWSEAMNPNRFAKGLRKHVLGNLPLRCENFRAAPGLYVPRNENELLSRYAQLDLDQDLALRLDQVCR